MKKISLLLLIALYCGPAFAAEEGFNSAMECYLDTDGTKDFYFCGNQSMSCKGKKAKGHHNKHQYYHGDSMHDNDIGTAWCCHGTGSQSGRFVLGDKWETEEIITVQLENSTCTYIKRTNVCGDVTDDPCTKATNCKAGYIIRNGECVPPCISYPDAFNGLYSNECIKCETTQYQGRRMETIADKLDPESPDPLMYICIQCDSATEFWDNQQKKCIKKSSLTQIPKTVLAKCFGCSNNEDFKECVEILANKSISETDTPYKAMAKKCHITTNRPEEQQEDVVKSITPINQIVNN